MPSSHLILCRPLLLLPQSLPASESFPKSQSFAWGGQNTGVSALASFLPKKSQGWSPLKWTGWISLQSKGLSRVFSNTTVQKHQFFSAQLSLWSNSHSYMTTGKPIAFTRWTFVSEYYNMASVLCFSLLAVRHRGSNSPNRDQIHTPLNWKWNPNFWTAAREVPPQQILHVRTEESRRLNYLWSHSWKKKKAALEPSFQARWSWTPCSWLQMVHDLPAFSVFVITWTYISLWPWAIH